MTDTLAAKLAALTARFCARASDEADAISAAIARGDRSIVAERAHKLAGNAGMLGQPEVSAAAFALEEAAEGNGDMAAAGERLFTLLAAL